MTWLYQPLLPGAAALLAETIITAAGASAGVAEVTASSFYRTTTLGFSGVTQHAPLFKASDTPSVGAVTGISTVAGYGVSEAASTGASTGVGAGTGYGQSAAASDGASTGTSSSEAQGSTLEAVLTWTTTLGICGYSQTYPIFTELAVDETGVGAAYGTAIVDGQARAYLNSVGDSAGTSTAAGVYEVLSARRTTLGLSGYSQTSPLLTILTSDAAAGYAYGTSTADAVSTGPIVEDVGTEDIAYISSFVAAGAGSVAVKTLTVVPSGGVTFAGTANKAKGYSLPIVASPLVFNGTHSARKTITWTVQPYGLSFGGSAPGLPNVQKSYEYFPAGGIHFYGTGGVSKYKNYGTGAGPYVRRTYRETHMIRRYYGRG